jgi:hypothetical protein
MHHIFKPNGRSHLGQKDPGRTNEQDQGIKKKDEEYFVFVHDNLLSREVSRKRETTDPKVLRDL